MKNITKEKGNQISYCMSGWMIWVLYCFYLILILVGIFGMIYILCQGECTNKFTETTVYSSLASGVAMSSMQYMRKLYKVSIGQKIIIGKSGVKEWGNFVYFISRPLFACVFIVVTIFALKGGIVIITNMPWTSENSRFIYVSTIVAAVIGFGVGDLLDLFEDFSRRKINKCLEEEHNG